MMAIHQKKHRRVVMMYGTTCTENTHVANQGFFLGIVAAQDGVQSLQENGDDDDGGGQHGDEDGHGGGRLSSDVRNGATVSALGGVADGVDDNVVSLEDGDARVDGHTSPQGAHGLAFAAQAIYEVLLLYQLDVSNCVHQH